MRRLIPPLSAAALLAFFVLLLFYRLLFTDRVLASGDILHYFYPYRDFAAEAFRAGRIPLWNPYIFMGAPFLANPQAAALYPPHWLLSWLPVTRQLYWSGAIHTWILALGCYALMRRWKVAWLSAVCAGLVLAGSGFYGGLLGHINQMNSAAWLPWLLWAATPVANSRQHHRTLVAGLRPLANNVLLFSTFVALTLLAGHTQTTYINLFGVGAWLLLTTVRTLSAGFRLAIAPLLVYAPGLLLGVLMAAAQLLPTLELSRLGLRSGGLSYMEVTSFSLRPLLLHWTLLPTYGLRDLGVVFATLGYTEFVAYVGALGLLLALVALVAARSRAASQWTLAAQCGLLFAGLGLFLAMGRWNPFSFLFYHLVPGFDLFRTPARWMMLYSLGMAILAGLGTEWIRVRWSAAARYLLLPALALDLLLAARALPHAQPTAPQAVYDVRTASAHLLTEPRRSLHPAAMGRLLSISEITFEPGDMPDWRRVLRGGPRPQLSEAAFTDFIIALKSQEILAPNLSLLWRIPTVDGFDGGVLPLQRYNAFLSLLIPPDELVPDGRVREQLREIPPAHLLELMDVRFVITDKVRDVWFDNIYYDRQLGAILATDGLRTLTVDALPSFQATTVAVVGYATRETDAAQAPAVNVPLAEANVPLAKVNVPLAEANMPLAKVNVPLAEANMPLAEVNVPLAEVNVPLAKVNVPLAEIATVIDGERRALGRLLTGGQAGALAVAHILEPAADITAAPAIYRDGETGQQEYLARFPLPEPARLDALAFTLPEEAAAGGLALQALTLIDERTGTFVPLLPSDRGRFQRAHSGDVKIYQRLEGSARAQLFGSVRPAPSPHEAVTMLRAADSESVQTAPIVEAGAETVAAWGFADAPASNRELSLVSYAPERIVIRTDNEQPAFLVLKDAYYPGWQATVNGQSVEIYATNVLFRGVPLPAGENEVIFSYSPRTWRIGLYTSLAGGLLWLLLALWKFGAGRARTG